MSHRLYRRLTRYAAFAIAHFVVAIALFAAPLGGVAALVLAPISLPLLLAWGPYQVDVAMNPRLTRTERHLWRVTLWCLPWSMALYWHRHVRGRSGSL